MPISREQNEDLPVKTPGKQKELLYLTIETEIYKAHNGKRSFRH